MRAKLTLRPKDGEVSLNYNYNYYLSSSIYDAFEKADPQLANYLHRSKEIKLYTFSRILAPGRKANRKLLIKLE